MTLWGGRFEGKLDPGAWELNASIQVDQRLADQDVRGSIAWAGALKSAGVLTEDEFVRIKMGLQNIHKEFIDDDFKILKQDEDIHSAVERRLNELIGPLAGKLHTGRSRNDQVATDSRLWLLDHLPLLDASLAGLQSALIWRAEADIDQIMPGYTHLQRAQPILISHWWLSHFWPLQRDRERLDNLTTRTSILPLGSAALAGTPFPIDRVTLASDLGFEMPSFNSIDSVSDRDFVAEFLFASALTGVHLSRLAEAIILFCSAEFGFIDLPDAYTTGSSLMPQKRNPDIFELARSKTGPLIGNLTAILIILKGLPSSYDKDLQEDKVPIFQAFDTLHSLLPVISDALRSLRLRPERLDAAIDPASMATDLADELVRSGVPFREAHNLVGKAVQFAERSGKSLSELTQEELKTIIPDHALDLNLDRVFDPWESIAARNCIGGSSLEAVKAQIQRAWQVLPNNSNSH